MKWGFLDWVRGRPFRADRSKPSLPKRPSRERVRRVVLLLLDSAKAYDAYKVLEPHQAIARPILEHLLRDDTRFREMAGKVRGWERPRYDVVLTILFEWRSEYAVEHALALADSTDAINRAVAARLLASTGEARFASVLARLSEDSDVSVPTAIGRGISHVLEYGELYGRKLDDDLVLALFDYLMSCALRTDRGPGHGFATLLFRVDRARAARDLAQGRSLTFERNWLHDLLVTLSAEGVAVPVERVRVLLNEARTLLDGDDFDVTQRPSVGRLTSELVCMLSEADPNAARECLRHLQAHRHEAARYAGQDARERLSGDPMKTVHSAVSASGGDPSRLRHEHITVYLVWSLDVEVCNGGWLQWVANSSGAHANETLEALVELGATGAAEELRKVLTILGAGGSSPDQRDRMKAIDQMMNTGRSLPDDSVMWNMQADLRRLISEYAERHPEAFRA